MNKLWQPYESGRQTDRQRVLINDPTWVAGARRVTGWNILTNQIIKMLDIQKPGFHYPC